MPPLTLGVHGHDNTLAEHVTRGCFTHEANELHLSFALRDLNTRDDPLKVDHCLRIETRLVFKLLQVQWLEEVGSRRQPQK